AFRLPRDDQASVLVDQLRWRRQSLRSARSRRRGSGTLPDTTHGIVAARVVRALSTMFGFASLAPSPSRLFVHATAGMFTFGLVLALPGTLFGTPAWTSAIG